MAAGDDDLEFARRGLCPKGQNRGRCEQTAA
jgi:hypothetical protein